MGRERKQTNNKRRQLWQEQEQAVHRQMRFSISFVDSEAECVLLLRSMHLLPRVYDDFFPLSLSSYSAAPVID